MSENLPNKDELLDSLVDGLKRYPSTLLVNLQVDFLDRAGDVLVTFYGARVALEVIAKDLYFDEEHSWQEAVSAEVTAY